MSILRLSITLPIKKCYFPKNEEYIDRTKAVTQHFLENSFKKLSMKKKKKRKNRKTQKYIFSKCLLPHDVVRVFVSSHIYC